MSAHDIIPLLYGILAGLLFWPLRRLFDPWRCKCGYTSWRAIRLIEHIEMKHSHEK